MDDLISCTSNLYKLSDLTIVSRLSGFLTNNYHLRSAEKDLFLKEYSQKEIFGSAHLRNKSILALKALVNITCEPIRIPSTGETVFEKDGRLYSLFPYIEGEIVDRTNLTSQQAFELGRVQGIIHKNGKQLAPQSLKKFEVGSKDFYYDKFNNESEEVLKKLDSVPHVDNGYHKELLIKSKRIINDIYSKSVGLNIHELSLVHGDFHERNVIFDLEKKNIIAVIDFDKMRYGPNYLMMLIAVIYSCLESSTSSFDMLIHSYLEGYFSVVEIDEQKFQDEFYLFQMLACSDIWPLKEFYLRDNAEPLKLLSNYEVLLNNWDEIMSSIQNSIAKEFTS